MILKYNLLILYITLIINEVTNNNIIKMLKIRFTNIKNYIMSLYMYCIHNIMRINRFT